MKSLRVNGIFVALTVSVVMLILVSIFGGYWYWKYYTSMSSADKHASIKSDGNPEFLSKIRAIIEVPADEEPTIASVTDQEKLQHQAFFSHAKNGDKVVIFSSVKKAILYRPSSGKIIEVGPISITTSSAEAKEPILFVLYNGTDVTGLTKKYETTLKDSIKEAVVADRDNAKKRDYATSLIVDLSGTRTKEVTDIAASLTLEVGTLPAGETKPASGDFLIILGADKK